MVFNILEWIYVTGTFIMHTLGIRNAWNKLEFNELNHILKD